MSESDNHPPLDEIPTDGEIDLSLLKDSLAKTPWGRMQANDDAVNFADSLCAAMLSRNKLKKELGQN